MRLEPDPGPHLPASLTLCLYQGQELLFSSGKHWLHPLFELEAVLEARGPGREGLRLVDRVTGRAAACLVARLGIRQLDTLVLSRRALPVLEAHGVAWRCGELVDRIPCATEDLLADTLDLDAAWSILQERRLRSITREDPMKKVQLAYGRTGLELAVPEGAQVIEPRHLAGLADEAGAVRAALRAPLGTPPLRDLVKATDQVAIVISDLTRPTPNEKLVPWLMAELDFVPRENFVIINGLGSHRANTRDELIQMLGQEIVDTVRVENHDAFDDARLTHVGRNTYGAEVYLNRTYVEADVRIVTGFIEPHFFAGFSGGPKGINPGISGITTILAFHNAQMIGHPNSTWGLLEGNILQDSAVQNCLMARPQFMLNVTLNGAKAITNVFAGDVIEAHRAGCAFVKDSAMYAVDEPFDIVVTTNSGYPLDQNLYQTVKGMSAAAQIVRQGGAILSVSECSDGLPNHGNYAKILQMRETPQELLDLIEDPAFSMFDQWQVQVQALIQLKAEVHLHSLLDPETVRRAKFIPAPDLDRTLAELLAKFGPGARVAVLPYGPLTIPYVKAR